MSTGNLPTQRQKDLAERIKNNQNSLKPPTEQEWKEWDAFWWDYYTDWVWHGASYVGIKRRLSRAIPTACAGWIDGDITVLVNPDYFMKLKYKGKCFVLHHELEHILRSHPSTVADWPEKQMALNFIMDALVNESLIEENRMFTVDNLPDKIIRYTELCSLLKQGELKWPEPPVHKFISEYIAEELLKYFPKDRESDLGNIIAQKVVERIEELYGTEGETFDDGSIPDEVKTEVIGDLIAEAEKTAGYTPAYLKRYIDAIKDKTNRNWRGLIRGAGRSSRIRMDRSWSHYNKKKPFLAPGRFIYTEPRGMVMVDTSGSIGQQEMTEFIREINNISVEAEIDMGFIDAKWDPENIEGQFVQNIKAGQAWKHNPVGGGGTAFKEFFDFMKSKPRNYYNFCIVLTDGYTCDNPLVPGLLARQCYALMTPVHNTTWAQEAISHGWKVAVIDDSKKKG